VSIEEVRTLVAERQRYDDWLTALKATRADTPPRVYERVLGDYLARRGKVIARLQSHVGALSTLGREIEDRLHELEARLADHEEELAEGMLRKLVGEYDGDRWETVRQDAVHKIEALRHKRDALTSDVDDVKALLARARMAPVAYDVAGADVIDAPKHRESAAVMEPTPVAEAIMPADELEDTAEIAVPLAFASGEGIGRLGTAVSTDTAAKRDDAPLNYNGAGIAKRPVPQETRQKDVPADVAALFDTPSTTAIPKRSAPIGAAPTDRAKFDDALGMFGEITSEADAEFLRSLDGIVAERAAPPRGAAPRVDSPTATATPPTAKNPGDPFDDLAFLRSVTGTPEEKAPAPAPAPPPAGAASGNSAKPQKSLRCTECGTMNLPTEWYCERCGGELAAL